MRPPLIKICGAAAPLPLANIDTDVIIRIERLTAEHPEGLAAFAFEALRFDADGRAVPDFPFNQPRWRNASILIAGANFGCGSSREPAVTALMDMGLRCIIASSFGDIFYANCFQNGLLPIRLSEAAIASLTDIATRIDAPWEIDLDRCQITAPQCLPVEFAIDGSQRESLMTGLDDLELTLRDMKGIEQWQKEDRALRPWVWQPVAREASR